MSTANFDHANTMLKTARLLTAIAVAAMTLPLAVAQPTDAKDTKEAKDAKKKKAAPPPLTPQEQRIENTGKETRTLAPPPKMTPEEKKADKALKRKAPTKEEEEKAKKASPG